MIRSSSTLLLFFVARSDSDARENRSKDDAPRKAPPLSLSLSSSLASICFRSALSISALRRSAALNSFSGARERKTRMNTPPGVRRLGGPRGSPCTFERLRGATSLVASNDRRLRLRCANAGSILLSKQQLYSWLSNLDEGLEEEEEEE